MTFLQAIDKSMFRWVQYVGLEVEDRGLFFKFKSSQNSLSFSVYAGVNVGDTSFLLQGRTDEIYEHFKAIKVFNGVYE